MPLLLQSFVFKGIFTLLLICGIQEVHAFNKAFCLPLNECTCEKMKVKSFVINHYGCGVQCFYYQSTVKEYVDILQQDGYCSRLR